jgi:phospholipid/cholesterol/gamma-HCH transport system substrate-binding protein
MSQIPPSPPPSPVPPDAPPDVKNIEIKAALLVLLLVLLLIGSVAYVLYARGAFERTQTVVLVSDDSDGVVVGMNMTFAGFAIGRVSRIELGDDGNARIIIDVPRKDARWLRKSSVFTMERGLVGGPRIKAFSGVLDDPPLEDGAVRQVLRGDASAEIPRLQASIRDLLDNLTRITKEDAALAQTLANTQAVTEKLKGPQGAMGVLFGNEQDAKKIVDTIERSNAVLARAEQLTRRLDSLVANADRQVFGQGAGAPGSATGGGLVGDVRNLVGDVRNSTTQINGLLGEARGSLQKVDKILQEAQGIASNTREATTDLGQLRGEVESSLRKVDGLINELNRKWPFARDAEIKLP